MLCWAISFNFLLGLHYLFKNGSSTLNDMGFKFSWANYWWWSVYCFKESVLSHWTFTWTSLATWTAVDDGAIFTLGQMALAFVFIDSQQAVSLDLNRINFPCSWTVSSRLALWRRVWIQLSEWTENFLHAKLTVTAGFAIRMTSTDIIFIDFSLFQILLNILINVLHSLALALFH